MEPSPFKHPWWHMYRGVGEAARTKDDWLIGDVVNSIRTKPEWKTKYKNDAIAAKWKAEIKHQFARETRYIDAVVEYVFRELEWYESTEKHVLGGQFSVGCHDRIVHSDLVVPDELRAQLLHNADILAKSIDVDYHPNSNNQVIDLVHPSLFPVQYGQTPIVKGNEVSVVEFSDEIAKVKKNVEQFGVSKSFQWIPAELKLSNGKGYQFLSYINNLHPETNSDLYQAILSVFSVAVPGLDYVLSRYASEPYRRIPIGENIYTDEFHELRDQYEEEEDDEGLEELDEEKEKYLIDLSPKYDQGPVTDNQIKLADFDSLKVIVKLANIELTPENPSYPGGSWHVEGTINEDIVATVLYYYDVENITESRLSIRTAFEDPRYEQNDSFICSEIYGLETGDSMQRTLGAVEAKQGRVVIFPNCYQHHVDAFELLDKTKNGHRKILCFFVVDPYNKRVVSTAQVPPQQREWWEDQPLIDRIIPDKSIQNKLKHLRSGSWIQSLVQAKLVRQELMAERAIPVVNDEEERYMNGTAYVRAFSLCEH